MHMEQSPWTLHVYILRTHEYVYYVYAYTMCMHILCVCIYYVYAYTMCMHILCVCIYYVYACTTCMHIEHSPPGLYVYILRTHEYVYILRIPLDYMYTY